MDEFTAIRAFLAARYDEDEATARAATQGRWHRNQGWASSPSIDAGEYDTVIGPGEVRCATYCYGGSSSVEVSDEDAAHIAHHDPARVLAEVAAKRAILAAASDYMPELDSGDNGEWALDLVVRHLASPYADHPDYSPEWAV